MSLWLNLGLNLWLSLWLSLWLNLWLNPLAQPPGEALVLNALIKPAGYSRHARETIQRSPGDKGLIPTVPCSSALMQSDQDLATRGR